LTIPLLRRRALILPLACILPFAAGCRSTAPHHAPPPTGSILGSVTVAAPVAQPTPTQFAHDPGCASLKNDRQFRLEDHPLPHSVPPVFLWISAGLPRHAPASCTQVVLTQFQCEFQPQIIGVLPNQSIDFSNSDPFSAQVTVKPAVAGNLSLSLTLPPEKPGQLRSFPHPELLIPVTSPQRPWMKAWINVVPNSHFTLSGPHGRFTLRHLPPGTYTLSALRPGFPVQTQSVTIRANAATQATFTFSAGAPGSKK
jgi:hypothetical protein